MTGVLFDLDDTLFDHQAGTRVALDTLRGRYEALRPWPADELARRHAELLERLHLEVLAGRLTVDTARVARFTQLFADAGVRLTSDDALDVAMAYRDAYLESWRLVPGAVPLLEALRPVARLGVVTNNVVSEQRRKVEVLGLAPFLDVVVISEAEGVSKPDPRIFAIALERLGCLASTSVMVGDAWATDIAGARAAGLRAVWFNPSGRPMPPDADGVVELRALEPTEHARRVILAGETVY